MKTKILMIAGLTAMLFTCQTLQAQIRFGVHAAGNLETQAELGQLWNNVQLYQGFLVGGFMEYRANNSLSFQTELNYQKKGAKFISTLNGSESVERKEFNYISAPLLLRGNIHDESLGENWGISLFTGPYIGYLTSANSKMKTGNITTNKELDNQAEKADWGFIFGGGVSYKLSDDGAIIAELRYQMGLTEVDKNVPDLRNKGMGITIGYRF
jgi:hypothetical protein